MNRLDENLFEFAEVELKTLLIDFIANNKIKSIDIDGGAINYYDVGDSDDVIVIIPSNSGSADAFFRYIQELSKKYRVIVPFYRDNVKLENQYKGFIELINYLKLSQITLFAYAFGGIIAQLIVRDKPELVRNLILFDSETKTENLPKSLVKKYIKSYKRVVKMMKFFSYNTTYKSMERRIDSDVKFAIEKNKHFWEAFYTQVLKETSKERMLSLNSNVLEFWSNYLLRKEEFTSFKGRVILLTIDSSLDRETVSELSNLFENVNEVVYKKSFRMALVSCFENILVDISKIN